MIIGNILTTLFAANLIDNYITNKDFNLRGPVWIWYSLIGVFGFEAMIQKINVTFFDQGVLTINDWISRAKNSATAAPLEKAADLDILFIQKQASQLQKKLTKEEIHTFATHNLGPAKYQEILSSITSNSNINPEHYLAHILANEVPKKVKALLKTHA